MAANIEETLCNILAATEFILQLDESTLPGDESLLLAYVRLSKMKSWFKNCYLQVNLKQTLKESQYLMLLRIFSKRKASHFLIFIHEQQMEHHPW